jgi:cysteine desulfurase/selenocysteine lyase
MSAPTARANVAVAKPGAATRTAGAHEKAPFDVRAARADFPALAQSVHGKPLVFLDSAASAQKPKAVLDAIADMYGHTYANVHRGVHALSERATARYEGARATVARFINASNAAEIVFTGGATDAINLVAQSFGPRFLKAGDEIVITELEHHSNIVPWQLLRDRLGLVLKAVPITDAGEITLDAVKRVIGPRTRLVAISHMSNALGSIQPVRDVCELAHAQGAKVLVDGCQAIAHLDVDVRALGCDFYVFSGHKIYGPTGIGVLWGRADLLQAMPPWRGGGEMIRTVTLQKSTFAEPPARFEAGTPPFVQAVGLAAALDYLGRFDRAQIHRHEADVLTYATAKLTALDGVKIIGTAPRKAAILSFTIDCAHPHDIATVLDRAGVAVRAGHHCAQPLMERLGVTATTRASFALYSTRSDADALSAAVQDVIGMFGR